MRAVVLEAGAAGAAVALVRGLHRARAACAVHDGGGADPRAVRAVPVDELR